MKRLLAPIILLISLIFPASYAQQPVFRHYTVDEGLPSNEIYHVFQDSKGYVWIATNMGVCRYDGRHFKNFDKQDGLAENTVFEVYEDFKGRVWFVSFPCQLSYFENGVINQYRYNSELKKFGGSGVIPVKNTFKVKKDERIYLSFHAKGLITISKSGELSSVNDSAFLKIGLNIF
ncbi:MAG TPA: two-component regulator propeller domain-containing protein, partial [Lentimicrobium sp.]|nr:two-component regulator propeller domain-containing protein [Lentimicrobium sp.]